MRRLVVALDAVAALAEASELGEPRIAPAAVLAEVAGADGIRASVREALRPVNDTDLRDLRRVTRRFELRLAPKPGLLGIALDARPDRVVLAGSVPAGMLVPAPLDLETARDQLNPAVRTLREAGIEAAVSLAPELEAVKLAHGAGVTQIEFFTGRMVDLPDAERARALDGLRDAASLAAKLRLPVSVGGGLERRSLDDVLRAAPASEAVTVGRGLVARAMLVGIERAVHEYAAALA